LLKNSLGTLLKLPELYLPGGIFSKLLYFEESLSGGLKFFEVAVLFISAGEATFFTPVDFVG
jgi:hypothetical protein